MATWNITLRCGHRYQVQQEPDLVVPRICGQPSTADDPAPGATCGLQMIVAAANALYEETQAHNELAADRRRRLALAARRRVTADRRAAVARGEVAPDASH